MDEVKEIYDDIEVQENEFGEVELGFKTKSITRKFVKVTSKMSVMYRDDKTRFSMQFVADVLKGLKDDGKITIEQLYDLKESDVIRIIEDSKYKDVFNKWRTAKTINTSKEKPENVYFVQEKTKVRYIDPLCRGKRMSRICETSENMIRNNLSYDMDNFVFLDFSL